MSLRELSPTERRCVIPYLSELQHRTGNMWRVGPKLERKFPDRKTPECLLFSRRDRVAVEVKGLFDDRSPSLFGWVQNLEQKLSSVRHGYYMLHVPREYWGQSLPFQLVSIIRQQIDGVGRGIAYGERGFIRVPITSLLTRDRDGHSRVACTHGHVHKGKDQLDGRVDGLFFLHDDGTAGTVHSKEAADDFAASLLSACEHLVKNSLSQSSVRWEEEWEVSRYEGNGVFIPVASVGDAGAEAIRPLLVRALKEGASKFAERRWAPVQTLLIALSQLAPDDLAGLQKAFEGVAEDIYEPLDEIWVLYKDEFVNLYTCGVGFTAPRAPSLPASA